MAIGPFNMYAPPGVWGPSWTTRRPTFNMGPVRPGQRHRFGKVDESSWTCVGCGAQVNPHFSKDGSFDTEFLERTGLGRTCADALALEVMEE